MGATTRGTLTPGWLHGLPDLVGRRSELAAVDALLDGIADGGAALVWRGDAGIGKSALLEAARERAGARGITVLRTVGAVAETGLAFSGLQRLLDPVLDRADALRDEQRAVLLAAIGAGEGAVSDLFLVALATLELVGVAAAERPVVMLADDVQWLDAASRDVLGFVGRRVESEPVVVLAALRDGYDDVSRRLDLRERRLEGLDDEAARELLDARARDLSPGSRSRLLEQAAGNPLALIELPTTAAGASGPILPITARLEQAFTARLGDVPPATGEVLLTAAADDSGALAVILAASEILGARPARAELLQPALDAGLVAVVDGALRFRHPLVRSAIYQAAALDRRHAAHAALAEVLVGQPDRRAWHRAASVIGCDDGAAEELEEMAWRAHRRGAILHAATALGRAGHLTVGGEQRARRLLRAAELAFELGRADLVRSLVEEAQQLALSERDRARGEWLAEIFHDGVPGDGERVLLLVDHAARAVAEGDADLALKLLLGAALRCWWSDPGPAVRDRVVAVAESAGAAAADPRLLATLAVAAPIACGPLVMGRLAEAAQLASADPRAGHLVGMAAFAVGHYEAALAILGAAVDGLREHGRLGLLTQVLGLQCWSSFLLGDWSLAASAAAEEARLARETGQPMWGAAAAMALGGLAGARGDEAGATALLDEADSVLRPRRISALLCLVEMQRGLASLTAGRSDEAYARLKRIFDPADPAHHYREQYCAVGLYADAASLTGHREEARTVVRALGARAAASGAPGLLMELEYARPVLADDDEAESLFLAALHRIAERRPFDRARLNLAFGMWLRRRRRVIESREHLRRARDAFDQLHVPPWAERARRELRAAGEANGSRRPTGWDELSPQEQQIARMAAAGQSNREIAQRLYLSHRTVANHLYRAFPKLGITSRSQLHGVLPAVSA